jgi:hypothetical protein
MTSLREVSQTRSLTERAPKKGCVTEVVTVSDIRESKSLIKRAISLPLSVKRKTCDTWKKLLKCHTLSRRFL